MTDTFLPTTDSILAQSERTLLILNHWLRVLDLHNNHIPHVHTLIQNYSAQLWVTVCSQTASGIINTVYSAEINTINTSLPLLRNARPIEIPRQHNEILLRMVTHPDNPNLILFRARFEGSGDHHLFLYNIQTQSRKELSQFPYGNTFFITIDKIAVMTDVRKIEIFDVVKDKTVKIVEPSSEKHLISSGRLNDRISFWRFFQEINVGFDLLDEIVSVELDTVRNRIVHVVPWKNKLLLQTDGGMWYSWDCETRVMTDLPELLNECARSMCGLSQCFDELTVISSINGENLSLRVWDESGETWIQKTQEWGSCRGHLRLTA